MHHLRLKTYLTAGDICHAATTTLDDREPLRLHDHDFFEIFLILEGRGHHLINGRKLALRPGDLVFIRPPDGHGFLPARGQSLRLLNIAFTAAWFRSFRQLWPRRATISHWLKMKMPPTISLPDGSRKLLEQIGFDLTPARPPRHLGLARFCLEALELLDRGHSAGRGTAPPDWLERAVAAMDAPGHLQEDVASFQRRAGRSPEHFTRTCRRFYGMTPTELLNQARVRLAQRWLLQTQDKIIDICHDCGFQNLSYFHRTFRRISRCTPRHWRLRHVALTVPR